MLTTYIVLLGARQLQKQLGNWRVAVKMVQREY